MVIASKRVNYLGINLTREMQDRNYTRNWKTLLKKNFLSVASKPGKSLKNILMTLVLYCSK